VPCVVSDAKGAPVTGLTPDDFAVSDDGAPRAIKYLWRETDLPLTVALVVDVSGTQVAFWETHREALQRFAEKLLSRRDRALLVAVSIQQRLVTDLTDSTEELRAGTELLISDRHEILGEPCPSRLVRIRSRSSVLACSSPIWNGVFFAANLKLRLQPGRKAMLLLTDGLDGGSQHGLDDAIRSCQNADTTLYSIQYFDFFKKLPPGLPEEGVRVLRSEGMRRQLEHDARKCRRNLERLSTETGGRFYDGEAANVDDIFSSIEADLRSQYVIGYTQPKTPKRGYHRIKVRVNRPGLVVRARDGYHVQ
jgi:VWFA-related protein